MLFQVNSIDIHTNFTTHSIRCGSKNYTGKQILCSFCESNALPITNKTEKSIKLRGYLRGKTILS